MASSSQITKDTQVLAIASHVVYGYVGNKVTTFVLQSMGLEVSGINTVNYSNHTGYRQFKGTKTSAGQIWDLYTGLQQSHLDDFDILLSGYIPSAEAVEAVGKIAMDLKNRDSNKPGSFFWILDPVMGDSGVFYVPPSEAPVYQSLLPLCHLLLPNQFELETLTNTKIVDITSLVDAVGVLHREYKVPHVFVTSTMVKEEKKGNEPQEPSYLTLIGSTAKADGTPRAFIIKAPYFPVYFVGTGDTFAALITARLREEASRAGLLNVDGWVSPDGVSNLDLPLAKAAETVVASMQALLSRTHKRYEKVKATVNENNSEEEYRKETRLKLMKAAELKVVGHVNDLTNPPGVEQYRARSIDLGNFK